MDMKDRDRATIWGILHKTSSRMRKLWLYGALAAGVLTVVSVFLLLRILRNGSLTVGVGDASDDSITELVEMRGIGEWEFLSIEDEEMIDTIRKGIFNDDCLVRIFYGTLRIGIDLSEADDDWLELDGNRLTVKLPAIRLLDDKFIDEARTKSFFETGAWSDKDRADMYLRAYNKMESRCLTTENIETAQANATRQFSNILSALGFHDTAIVFR